MTTYLSTYVSFHPLFYTFKYDHIIGLVASFLKNLLQHLALESALLHLSYLLFDYANVVLLFQLYFFTSLRVYLNLID